MGGYYKGKRTKNIFDPKSKESFTLSRSKIDLFYDCPRCFYLDRRLGVNRPPGFPFNLNSAVDELFKKEFDAHRVKGTQHPLMEVYGIDAVPFSHEKMDAWRDSLRRGISFMHEETNLFIRGGIDDVWINKNDELMVVDYKATSKNGEVSIDAPWQDAYKRQIEVYQWLFKKNGFKVSDTGYFVYANGRTDLEAFDGKLEFDVKVIPYTGSTDWVEKTLFDMKKVLMSNVIPEQSEDCDYCKYREAAGEAFREHVGKHGTAKNPKKEKENQQKLI